MRRPRARRRDAQMCCARALPCTCTGTVLVLALALVIVVAPCYACIVDLARRGPVPASGASAGSSGGDGGTGSLSRPASPAPKFGAVITSPRTRRAASASGDASPLSALQQQLRIPMPELHHHHHHQVAPLLSLCEPGRGCGHCQGCTCLALGCTGT